MKKILVLLAFTLLSQLSFAHELVFSQNNVVAQTRWEKSPRAGAESVMLIQFYDARTHEAIEPSSTLSVVLWMKDMNHGSGPTAVERVLDQDSEVVNGLMRVRNMWFVMAGNWEIRVSLKAETQTETQTFSEIVSHR